MSATITILNNLAGITTGYYQCFECAGARSNTEYTHKYTLIFLLKGSFRHEAFRSNTFLTSESVLFKKPGYEYRVSHEHHVSDECIFMHFTPEALDQLRPYLNSAIHEFLRDDHKTCMALRSDPEKSAAAWQLYSWAGSNTDSLRRQSVIIDLIGSVLCQDPALDHRPSKPIHESVDKAKQYIAQHFHEELSLTSIAAVACLSPFQFSRVYKTATGYSPHQYLLRVRLKRAADMLQNTDLSVADTAYASGFENPDYFTSAFKSKIGKTPGQFRNNPRIIEALRHETQYG